DSVLTTGCPTNALRRSLNMDNKSPSPNNVPPPIQYPRRSSHSHSKPPSSEASSPQRPAAFRSRSRSPSVASFGGGGSGTGANVGNSSRGPGNSVGRYDSYTSYVRWVISLYRLPLFPENALPFERGCRLIQFFLFLRTIEQERREIC